MRFMHLGRARFARTNCAWLATASLLFIAGCQSPQGLTAGQQALSQIQQGPSAEQNELGLHRVNIPEGQGILYVKAPRPHLERFDRLAIESVQLEPKGGVLPWNDATTNRLRRSFARALEDNLKQQKAWKMTEDSGPGVLGLRVTSRELTLYPGLPHVSVGRGVPVDNGNKTTLVMELYDPTTDEVLVQFIQRRDLPARVHAGSEVEVDRLRIYYSGFANSIGDSLAQLAQAVQDVGKDEKASPPR